MFDKQITVKLTGERMYQFTSVQKTYGIKRAELYRAALSLGLREIREVIDSKPDDLDLGSARGDKVAAVVDKKIFVVGGEDKHEDLCLEDNNLEPSVAAQAVDSVEVLDPLEKSPKWKNEADFPVERFRAASALDEKSNKLYVFGGQKAYSNDCDCYKTADEIYVHEGEQRGGGLSTTATALIATASVLAVVGSALFFFRRRNQKE